MSDNRRVFVLRAMLVCWAMLACWACGSSAPPPVKEHAFVVAASFNPVKECETTSFGRYVRGASCPGAELLFISRPASPEVTLQSMRAELSSLGQEVQTRSLLINGKEWETISVSYGPGEQPIVSSLATVLPMAGAGSSDSVEVQCFAQKRLIDPKRCRSLLESFIAQGLLRGEWPSVLAQSDARRSIAFDVAGREVLLPSQCDELGLFDVDCPEGHVQMHILAASAQLPSASKALLAQRANATLALERELDCMVDGFPARCIVRRFRLPYGDELHTYHAALELRGMPLLISCEARRSHAPILPGSLCSRFFAFEDGVLLEPPLE